MRENVKVRMVAGSMVVSLPQSVLEPVGLKEGDRVIVESAPPRRLIITKEGNTMTSTQHLEMEIDLLEKKKIAMASDLRFKEYQYKTNMPCDQGMSDPAVAVLVMEGLVRDRDKMDVEIAEKRIQLYEIQAAPVSQPTIISEIAPPQSPFPAGETRAGLMATPRATKGWYYRREEDGSDYIFAFVNHKGSCSIRRFDAQTGRTLKRRPNRRGDYQSAFVQYLENAVPLHLSKQPSLERHCKRELPAWLLTELQSQIRTQS